MMTRTEAEELLHEFSAAGLWARTAPLGGAEVRLDVRDDAIYGLRRSFRSQGHARVFLTTQ